MPVVEPISEEDWMWFRGDRVEILTGPDKGKQGYINAIVQVTCRATSLHLHHLPCLCRKGTGLQWRV